MVALVNGWRVGSSSGTLHTALKSQLTIDLVAIVCILSEVSFADGWEDERLLVNIVVQPNLTLKGGWGEKYDDPRLLSCLGCRVRVGSRGGGFETQLVNGWKKKDERARMSANEVKN